jgi:hypothetical protein
VTKVEKVTLLSALVARFQHVAGLTRALREDSLGVLGAGKVRVMAWQPSELVPGAGADGIYEEW